MIQNLIKNLQEKQMKEINGNRNSEFIRRTLKLKDSNYNKSIAIEKSNNIFNKFNFLNEGKNILQETVKSNFKLNEVISKEEALIESLKDYDFPTSIKFIKKFNSHQNKNFNSEHKGLIAKLRVKLMAQNVENSIEFYLELINQKDPFSTSLIDFFNFNNIVRNYYGIVFDYKEVEGYFSSFTSDLAHRKLDFCNLLIDASGMTYRKKYLTKNEYRLSFIKTNLVLKLGNNSFQNKSLHSYYTSIIESFLSFIELYFSQNCEVVTNSEFVFFISCLSFKIEFFKDSNREDIFKDYLELLDLL